MAKKQKLELVAQPERKTKVAKSEYAHIELVEPTKPKVGIAFKDSNAKISLQSKMADVDIDLDIDEVFAFIGKVRKGY